MNNAQKAQDWVVTARTTRDVLTRKTAPIEIITALLAERQAFVALLQDMLESDLLMGRITDSQIERINKLCDGG